MASKGGDKPQEEKADDNPRDGGERVDGEELNRIEEIEEIDWKKDDWDMGMKQENSRIGEIEGFGGGGRSVSI